MAIWIIPIHFAQVAEDWLILVILSHQTIIEPLYSLMANCVFSWERIDAWVVVCVSTFMRCSRSYGLVLIAAGARWLGGVNVDGYKDGVIHGYCA